MNRLVLLITIELSTLALLIMGTQYAMGWTYFGHVLSALDHHWYLEPWVSAAANAVLIAWFLICLFDAYEKPSFFRYEGPVAPYATFIGSWFAFGGLALLHTNLLLAAGAAILFDAVMIVFIVLVVWRLARFARIRDCSGATETGGGGTLS